jgi:hypothetical protein
MRERSGQGGDGGKKENVGYKLLLDGSVGQAVLNGFQFLGVNGGRDLLSELLGGAAVQEEGDEGGQSDATSGDTSNHGDQRAGAGGGGGAGDSEVGLEVEARASSFHGAELGGSGEFNDRRASVSEVLVVNTENGADGHGLGNIEVVELDGQLVNEEPEAGVLGLRNGNVVGLAKAQEVVGGGQVEVDDLGVDGRDGGDNGRVEVGGGDGGTSRGGDLSQEVNLLSEQVVEQGVARGQGVGDRGAVGGEGARQRNVINNLGAEVVCGKGVGLLVSVTAGNGVDASRRANVIGGNGELEVEGHDGVEQASVSGGGNDDFPLLRAGSGEAGAGRGDGTEVVHTTGSAALDTSIGTVDAVVAREALNNRGVEGVASGGDGGGLSLAQGELVGLLNRGEDDDLGQLGVGVEGLLNDIAQDVGVADNGQRRRVDGDEALESESELNGGGDGADNGGVADGGAVLFSGDLDHGSVEDKVGVSGVVIVEALAQSSLGSNEVGGEANGVRAGWGSNSVGRGPRRGVRGGGTGTVDAPVARGGLVSLALRASGELEANRAVAGVGVEVEDQVRRGEGAARANEHGGGEINVVSRRRGGSIASRLGEDLLGAHGHSEGENEEDNSFHHGC